MTALPIINLEDYLKNNDASKIAKSLATACQQHGFFYIENHGVSITLQNKLETLSKAFFALPLQEKMKIHMSEGGKAWRGYFPVAEELTSGKPDQKEGLYFGEELDEHHPKVKANTILHGSNLFPDFDHNFKKVVVDYMYQITQLGHKLIELIALSLNLEKGFFYKNYTRNPLQLFRIFHYPPAEQSQFGVGEHTDYGLLTILKQDKVGGLQIKVNNNWIDAPPIENTFICNIGDMLERITGGLYKSTVHRVINKSQQNRLSFPFFFDPNFNAKVQTIPNLSKHKKNNLNRWDNKSVFDFEGTYGDYMKEKVSKVFPTLEQ